MSKNEELGTIIDGIGASEHLDSSGERILIKGIDISSMTHDALVNFEHKSETSSQLIGKILEAVKIFNKEDCKNKRHEYYWEKAGKTPYLYIKAVLFDKFGHTGANDAVAMLKFDKALNKEDTRQVSGFSIEGSKLDKDGSVIKKCIARKMSFTAYPCNKACIAEILEPEKQDDSKKLISIEELKQAFKKSQEMEMDLVKAEGKYNLGLSSKLKPKTSAKLNYSKITPATGEHRPAKPWNPKQTLKPEEVSSTTSMVGTRVKHSKNKSKTGTSIYNNPETWKNELDTMSNSRKAILKSISGKKTKMIMMSEMTKDEKTMKRKEILKSMSEEAYNMFPHKEQLLETIKKQMPESSEEEQMAFAKTFAYIQLKKAEISLEKMIDLEKKGRCWDGYEPTPNKKPFSEGSCKKIKKDKIEDMKIDLKKKPIKKSDSVMDNEIKLYKFEDGTAKLVWGEKVTENQVNSIIKKELSEYKETENLEKKEKPFHNYNPNKHSKEGGLNDKAREKYNRENGSDLKRPVTGKVKAGSEASKRRKSFCARMSGVKGPTSKDGKLTPKGASLKRWKC